MFLCFEGYKITLNFHSKSTTKKKQKKNKKKIQEIRKTLIENGFEKS